MNSLVNLIHAMSEYSLFLFLVQVFADLLDPVIKERHNGYDPRVMKHPTDLDSSKVLLTLTVPEVVFYSVGWVFESKISKKHQKIKNYSFYTKYVRLNCEGKAPSQISSSLYILYIIYYNNQSREVHNSSSSSSPLISFTVF